MKVLLDSNVWVSAFATRGLCADLLRLALRRHGMADFELLMCAAVRAETVRILRDKFGVAAETLESVRVAMTMAREIAQGSWTPPGDFPDPDDVLIVGAAVDARADLLVTGDKALLDLRQVGALPIRSPRAAYEQLRGLDVNLA